MELGKKLSISILFLAVFVGFQNCSEVVRDGQFVRIDHLELRKGGIIEGSNNGGGYSGGGVHDPDEDGITRCLEQVMVLKDSELTCNASEYLLWSNSDNQLKFLAQSRFLSGENYLDLLSEQDFCTGINKFYSIIVLDCQKNNLLLPRSQVKFDSNRNEYTLEGFPETQTFEILPQITEAP